MLKRFRWPSGRRRLVPVLVGLPLLLALLPTPSLAATTWTQLATGSTRGISGLAPSTSGWVIARDNKVAGQNRIALLSPGFTVTELTWPGTAPQDLESLSAVPGVPNRYVTCTSARKCSVIDIAGTAITVRRTFTLPGSGTTNESFVLTSVTGRTVALWADRGSPSAAGKLHAAFVDLSAWTFGQVATASVRVPWPTGPIRHVSDAAVVNGHVIVSSATDPGDSGPFDSAVYDVGTLGRTSTRATLAVHTPTELGRFPGHKVEGLTCAAGTDLLGTDDEKAGGAVAQVDVC
jgi:hypothetical protein